MIILGKLPKYLYFTTEIPIGYGKVGPLNRFIAEMMGFPPDWTILPFQSGKRKA
jgi:hypothetical protein